MPKAARHTCGPNAAVNRKQPYPDIFSKSASKTGKENLDPKASSISKTLPKSDEITTKGDYRDIHLDEVKGEVPCYDNAATVRRKLKKLLQDKSTIPGTSKKWSQASMAAEMQELESRSHPVEYNLNATGPTARSLGNFMKKSGQMGGGDSPCYYWGYVMLEKLRIYNAEKKSKPRVITEQEIPTGHMRWDPSTQKLWCGPGLPMPSVGEMNNTGR
ncbi:hypothetical protein N7G274_000887 [Stereocaulon virgatum]|uniref:Uncharacterized protein n=1 Tax=Stereocaulon virgatum TaxID=373712 RepID=A0ABR4AMY1_9LECA